MVFIIFTGEINFATAGDAATVLNFFGDLNAPHRPFALFFVFVFCRLWFFGIFFCLAVLQACTIMVGKDIAANGECLVAAVMQGTVVFESGGFDIKLVGGNLALVVQGAGQGELQCVRLQFTRMMNTNAFFCTNQADAVGIHAAQGATVHGKADRLIRLLAAVFYRAVGM